MERIVLQNNEKTSGRYNMFLSGTEFWRYLDKAYSSVPGSGGSNPLHAFPFVHELTLPSDRVVVNNMWIY
jgi:hypothetical protein